MSAARPITILIAEDQSIIRVGLSAALRAFKDIKVVAESADGVAAVDDALETRPDVILMDIGLPLLDGIAAARQIKQIMPKVRILMFTSSADDSTINAALQAGADGYCFKDAEIEHLHTAITAVARGVAWLDPGIADRILRDRQLPDAGSDDTRLLSNSVSGIKPNSSATNLNSVSGTPPHTMLADRYLIESVLGSGGMGVVYKGRHLLMDRPVAIKMLHARHIQDESAVGRFKSEAKSLSALMHPNLVSVFDFGITSQDEPYMVMDYHQGHGLDKFFKSAPCADLQQGVSIFTQVCDALTAVHEHDIVHRDVKPGNIVVADNGLAKLVDFGIAKMVSSPEQGLTMDGQVVGTPKYMSPEQCMGADLDARSDIYALGCVMYEIFCGEAPFKADTYYEIVRQHVEDKPAQSLHELRPDLPLALGSIIDKCLAKAPADRYQSAAQLKDDLLALS